MAVTKEQVLELLNDVGFPNIAFIKDDMLDNLSQKQLEKAYDLLQQYKQITDKLRNMPMILMNKESNKVGKLIKQSVDLRFKILKLVSPYY